MCACVVPLNMCPAMPVNAWIPIVGLRVIWPWARAFVCICVVCVLVEKSHSDSGSIPICRSHIILLFKHCHRAPHTNRQHIFDLFWSFQLKQRIKLLYAWPFGCHWTFDFSLRWKSTHARAFRWSLFHVALTMDEEQPHTLHMRPSNVFPNLILYAMNRW